MLAISTKDALMKRLVNIKRIRKKRLILILIIVALLLGAGAATYVYGFGGSLFGWSAQDDDIDYSEPTEEQRQAGNDAKKKTIERETDEEGKPREDSESNTNNSESVSVIISAANQNEQTLQVRTLIHTLKEGTCQLRLTQGDTVISREADTQQAASSSTCQGFDIPISELAKGTWKLHIQYKNDDASGEASQDITIN